MGTGGISKRLIRLADVWLCNIKADLAYVTVAASTFFAAISGSAPATVAAIGSNVIPEMEKRGYPKEYSTGLAVSAGMVGVLIPPSIPFVMYGISSGASVSTLFMAGIIPGLLFSLSFCVVARIPDEGCFICVKGWFLGCPGPHHCIGRDIWRILFSNRGSGDLRVLFADHWLFYL